MAASRQALSDCGIRTYAWRVGGVPAAARPCAHGVLPVLTHLLLYSGALQMLALRYACLCLRSSCYAFNAGFAGCLLACRKSLSRSAASPSRTMRRPPRAEQARPAGAGRSLRVRHTTPWCSARLPPSLGLSPPTALALQHHDDGVSHLLGHILYGLTPLCPESDPRPPALAERLKICKQLHS